MWERVLPNCRGLAAFLAESRSLPSYGFALEAPSVKRHSRKSSFYKYGKPEAFRKESGKAVLRC